MKRFQFTIRDLLLIIVIAALAAGWWVDRTRLAAQLETDAGKINALRRQSAVEFNELRQEIFNHWPEFGRGGYRGQITIPAAKPLPE
jgi:hypothetical protein